MNASEEIVFEGEFPQIPERLLVASTRGRLHHHRVREGRQLTAETVIGEIRAFGGRVQIRSSTPGTFVGWLAGEGESVSRGKPVATVLPSDA